MKTSNRIGLSLAVAAALTWPQLAFPKPEVVKGKKCITPVTIHTNPKTGESVRSCRAEDGSIVSEPTSPKKPQ